MPLTGLNEDPKKAVTNVDKRIVCNVAEHDLTVREFKIFELYCKLGSYKETAAAAGISLQSMYIMKRKDWWKELCKTYLETAQDKLHLGLSSKVGDLVESISKIWDGTFDEPKLANAVVKSMEVFTKLGKAHSKASTSPLMQAKADLYIDNSTHTTNQNYFDMKPYYNQMTLEEAAQYSKDGKPIQRFIDMEKDKVIEIDYEEEV